MGLELNKIPLVDIDNGVFKYILIKVQEKNEGNGEESDIIIVRGYQRAKWHTDIFEEVQNTLLPLKCACLGGGKLNHDPAEKKILVYGESTGYGRADHQITSNILKDFYKDYTVTIGNE